MSVNLPNPNNRAAWKSMQPHWCKLVQRIRTRRRVRYLRTGEIIRASRAVVVAASDYLDADGADTVAWLSQNWEVARLLVDFDRERDLSTGENPAEVVALALRLVKAKAQCHAQ